MITSYISGEKIHSNESEAFSLYEKSRFGEKINGRIEYTWIEAAYLLIKKQMQILSKNKETSFDKLLSKAKKQDKRITVANRLLISINFILSKSKIKAR